MIYFLLNHMVSIIIIIVTIIMLYILYFYNMISLFIILYIKIK